MHRKMKDSGVEWIGEIPEHWEVVPAGNIFEEEKTKNRDNEVSNPFSFKYGTIVDKNIVGEINQSIEETFSNYTVVQPNTIMINGLNLNYDFVTQRVARVPQKGIITSAYLAVVPNQDFVSPWYAEYLLKSYDFCQAFHGMGTGIRKTLKYSEFKKVGFLIPEKKTQHRIAAYLDEKVAHIDNIIDKTKKTIEEYKKYKQALITEAVTKGLNTDVKMKDSGVEWIGQIPEHWNTVKMKYLYSFKRGLNITRADLVKSGIPAISYGDIHTRHQFELRLNKYPLPCVDQKYIQLSPRALLSYGDFIFADTSEDVEGVGNFTHYDRNDIAFASYHTIIAQPKTSQHVRYMAYMFDSDYFRNQLRNKVSGIKVYSITQSIIKNACALLPALSVQHRIAAYLDEKVAHIDNIIDEKNELIANLESYKKSLIYEVVTGKREVS